MNEAYLADGFVSVGYLSECDDSVYLCLFQRLVLHYAPYKICAIYIFGNFMKRIRYYLKELNVRVVMAVDFDAK